MNIYPWHHALWQNLWQQRCQQRLPHALLLTGNTGLGKAEFAWQFAQTLLCETQNEFACQKCRSCHLMHAGNHPDFFSVSGDEKNHMIKIDSIRELNHALTQTTQSYHYQVAIINPAQQLNRAAANALLKTLEEPPGAVIIILITNQVYRLPATIISRCQRISFNPQDSQSTVHWLQQQGCPQPQLLLRCALGAPLLALSLHQDGYLKKRNQLITTLHQLQHHQDNPLTVAGQWVKANVDHTLATVISLTLDMLRLKMQANATAITHRDCSKQLNILQRPISPLKLANFLQLLLHSRQLLQSSVAVNLSLVIEKVLLTWCQLTTPL